MSDTPAWLERVRALDAEQDALRERLSAASERIADDRAHTVSEAIDSYGRGGRAQVAELLGCTVTRVDQLRARARNLQQQRRPLLTHLPAPDELLERLYALELAAVDLTDSQRLALGHLVRGLIIDATWLEQLGPLLADEYAEAAADDDVPADDELVKTIASWSSLRALAVLYDLADGDDA